MKGEHPREEEGIRGIEYVSTGVPANFIVVRVPEENGVGSVRPGDLAVVDQLLDGSNGETVVFRYAEKAVFGECVVRDGEWFIRDGSGMLRNASEMISEGAVYRGSVRYVVRPGKGRK